MKTLSKILCVGLLGLAGLGITSAGCEKKFIPTIPMQMESEEPNQVPPYSVRRVGVFEDNFAYQGKRGVYEITDEKTKKKYLGVSGIGITELERVPQGRGSEIIER